MERISSGCGRREFSCKRVEYQVVASADSWCTVTSGRNFYVQAGVVTQLQRDLKTSGAPKAL
jgi:hypothetical protein